jgi:hypothetical protein
MGNKVILILGLGVFVLGSGCVGLAPAGYREEELGILNVEEDPGAVLVPGAETLDFEAFSLVEESPLLELCDCRFRVSENNGLVCLNMVCSEGCSEEIRQCASTMGGCTIRR